VGTQTLNKNLWPLQDRAVQALKEKFLEDASYDCAFICTAAAWLLACHYEKSENCMDAKECFGIAIIHCNAATEDDRQKLIHVGSSECSPAGEILDDMKKDSENHKRHWEDFHEHGSKFGLFNLQL